MCNKISYQVIINTWQPVFVLQLNSYSDNYNVVEKNQNFAPSPQNPTTCPYPEPLNFTLWTRST